MSPSEDRSSISEREVADDGSVDSASSYDSVDENVWYTNMMLQIVPESKRARWQPTGDTNVTLQMVPGCKRALSQSGRELANGHYEGAGKRQRLHMREEAYQTQCARQDVMTELLNATKPFYSSNVMSVDTPGILSIEPLLEQAIGRKQGLELEEAQKQCQRSESDLSESSHDDTPRPAPGTVNIVNDLESNQMMHVIQGHSQHKPTISFLEALEPSIKPRLVTLSFPPFLVVHVNDAYSMVTGYMSREVLGKPLAHCLRVQAEVHSVTALDGKLVHAAAKNDTEDHDLFIDCSVEVVFIGQERSAREGEEEEEEEESSGDGDDESVVHVTHYRVELDPLESEAGKTVENLTGITIRRAMISPESPCFQGVLG